MQLQSCEPKKTETAPNADYGICFTAESLHNLASPVTQVCCLADLIAQKYRGALDDEADTLFGFLKASAHRLQILLAGLKAYTELTTFSKPYRRCDGNALMADSLAVLEQAIVESHAVVTSDVLPELMCDPVQMTCVFTGLIENSIKFRGDRAPEIHVSISSQSDVWLISIRDNGIGIPSRQRERVFGMFHRLHSDAISGAGVGLAIAKRIVEQHGGNIWVQSELGYGATFFMTLPRNHS